MPLQGLEELVDMAGLSCWEVRLHDFQTRPSVSLNRQGKRWVMEGGYPALDI